MSQPTPAGWYPDPSDPSRARWWDGAQWTENTAPGATGAPAAPAAPTAPTAPAAAPRYGEYAPSASGAPAAPAWPTAAPAVTRMGPSAAGQDTNTIWIYLAIVASLLPVFIIFFIDWDAYLAMTLASVDDSAAASEMVGWFGSMLGLGLLSYLFVGASIVFSWLDWRELKKRGVAKPFHWGFSFILLAISTAAVYVIGRTVVVRRETGKGLTPLWVWIGLTVVSWIAVGVWFAAFMQNLMEILPSMPGY